MPLVLAPSYDDHTRQEIESHLVQVRARRMVAAIEYANNVNEKLQHESDKIQRRMSKEYEMLGKELVNLEKCEEKVQDRLTKIESLRQELGLTTDMIELHAPVTEREDV